MILLSPILFCSMHIQSCLHPRKITNKYTGETMFVPCRHCVNCVNKRNLELQTRIMLECDSHRYNYFFTLTYSDDNVPLAFIDRSRDVAVLPDGESVDLSGDDIDGFRGRSCFNVLCKKDLQKFIKRVRSAFSYYCFTHNIECDEKIRYFACGEYGPVTRRPHYHGILFCPEKFDPSLFKRIISACWKAGYFSWSMANEKRCRYVAKYVVSDSGLPGVYANKAVAPFFLYSKKPAIGNYFLGEDLQYRFFMAALDSVDVYRVDKYEAVPLWRSLEDTIFPKCKEFSSLSHFQRVQRYSIAQGDVIQYSDDGVNIRKYSYRDTPLFDLTLCEDTGELLPVSDGNLYRLSCKCLDFCRRFDLSVDDYVTNIETYYRKKEYSQLLQQYEFEVAFVDSEGNDSRYLVNNYPLFKSSLGNVVSRSDKTVLNTFGFGLSLRDSVYLSDLSSYFELGNISDYVSNNSINRTLYLKSLKTKKVNDYYFKEKSDYYKSLVRYVSGNVVV